MSIDFGHKVDPFEIMKRAGIDPLDHLENGEHIYIPDTRLRGMPCEIFYAKCCGKKYMDANKCNHENGYWDFYHHCQENH